MRLFSTGTMPGLIVIGSRAKEGTSSTPAYPAGRLCSRASPHGERWVFLRLAQRSHIAWPSAKHGRALGRLGIPRRFSPGALFPWTKDIESFAPCQSKAGRRLKRICNFNVTIKTRFLLT